MFLLLVSKLTRSLLVQMTYEKSRSLCTSPSLVVLDPEEDDWVLVAGAGLVVAIFSLLMRKSQH
jgi:hypothetical protein